jgi:hypothetical protein
VDGKGVGDRTGVTAATEPQKTRAGIQRGRIPGPRRDLHEPTVQELEPFRSWPVQLASVTI